MEHNKPTKSTNAQQIDPLIQMHRNLITIERDLLNVLMKINDMVYTKYINTSNYWVHAFSRN